MGTSVQINTPYLSAEEIADRLGMSEERRAFLRDLAATVKTPKSSKSSSTRTPAKKAAASRKAA